MPNSSLHFDYHLFPLFEPICRNNYIGVLDVLTLAVTTVVLLLLNYLIKKTKFGLNVRVIACNSHPADLLGLKFNVYPTMGNIGVKAFIASVLGGLGSVPGAIAGAVMLGVIEVFASGYLSSGLKDLISFTLLIVILIVKPSGLFGVDVQDKA